MSFAMIVVVSAARDDDSLDFDDAEMRAMEQARAWSTNSIWTTTNPVRFETKPN